jgi:hypothetical protein
VLLHEAQSPAAVAAAAAAAGSAAVAAVENIATVRVAGAGAEASADAALRLTDVAMAWLARENGGHLDAAWIAPAMAIAPKDVRAVWLHDEVFARLSPADSQSGWEASLTMLDQRIGQLVGEDRSRFEPRIGESRLVDSVFDMPTEMLLSSDDWLA